MFKIKFEKNSIFYKYFRKFSGYLLIPFAVLCIILYGFYFNSLINSSKEELQNFELKYLNYVDKNLEKISEMVNKFSVDNSTVKCAYSSLEELQTKELESVNKIYGIIGEYKNNYDFIDSIHIYFPKSDYVLSSINASNIEDFYKKDIICEIERNKEYIYLYNSGKKFDFCMPFYTQRKIGYILIITTNDNIFLHNNFLTPIIKNIQLNYGNEMFDIYASNHDISKFEFMTGTKKYNISFFDFIINMEYDYSANLDVGLALVLFFATILISVVLSTVVSAIMSSYYQREVAMIITKYEPFFITKNQKDELDIISFNIANLLQSNKQISLELSDKLHEIQQLQIKLLQSQLNPHFIFNTLNSICMYITVNCSNSELPVKMISILSSLARQALDIDKYFCTISDEIEYTKKYIEIEQIKYDYKFDVVWNVDETVLNSEIVKFILQPVVENAIYYGFRPLFPEYAGNITINIGQKNKLILITIKNTGIPIDKDKAEEINKSFEEFVLPSSHVGLTNTMLRIKTIYGQEYVGTIGVDNDGYTQVILKVPFN